MGKTVRVANPSPSMLALVNPRRKRKGRAKTMAKTRNRPRRSNGRFMKATTSNPRRRRRNKPTGAVAVNRTRHRRHRARNRVVANPHHRRRRNYTIVARNRHRRRHRNPGVKNFLMGALWVGIGMALTEFAMNYVPTISLGGALGPILEEAVLAYLLGWAAKKTRIIAPGDADLMSYGGFGMAVNNLLNTYVFNKLPTLFQSSGTASAVATAAATGTAIQQSGAAAPAPAPNPNQDGYFNSAPGTGVSDLVAFGRAGYENSYYGAGSGLGNIVGFRRMR
jgi:hypothetical protein